MFGHVESDRNSTVIRGFDRSVTIALGLSLLFCASKISKL
ncbi:hypothetical protein SLEP1_g38590 [Rubroshorea leprosula]|uniref:Transposase n=1 Tax=Rubroshorea leprosula TaxID=152421 RepID=A0AAV5KY46_9ROSI|nr:hypothetical protein SLEP1_g38590 [Rubroshorea leprosula]